MLDVKDRVAELHKQHKELSESKQSRDITQEFCLRSKMRDLNAACKVGYHVNKRNAEFL